MATALQVFLHLNSLQSTVESVVTSHKQRLRADIHSAVDVNALTVHQSQQQTTDRRGTSVCLSVCVCLWVAMNQCCPLAVHDYNTLHCCTVHCSVMFTQLSHSVCLAMWLMTSVMFCLCSSDLTACFHWTRSLHFNYLYSTVVTIVCSDNNNIAQSVAGSTVQFCSSLIDSFVSVHCLDWWLLHSLFCCLFLTHQRYFIRL